MKLASLLASHGLIATKSAEQLAENNRASYEMLSGGGPTTGKHNCGCGGGNCSCYTDDEIATDNLSQLGM